jgi:hypothetical protein
MGSMSNRKKREMPGLVDVTGRVGEGHELEDGDDVVIMARGSEADGLRRAAILPRSVSRLSGDAFDAVAELQRLGRMLQDVAAHIDQAVDEARECGASWNAIGWSLGTSGEAARQRWGSDGRGRKD